MKRFLAGVLVGAALAAVPSIASDASILSIELSTLTMRVMSIESDVRSLMDQRILDRMLDRRR